jgi:(1->4)-alpha-D-glucan 1-alpha-D-glucosylmutase
VARPETAAATKEELAGLARDPAIRPLIDRAIAATIADPALLHELHEAQIWRAAYWRAAREGLTYRRFFEIADLVGVRVERTRVFDDVHKFLLELIGGGHVQALRLDHIDGLADPKSYLLRLQEAIAGPQPHRLFIEKILGPGEVLRPGWPVAGTTGYEFIQALAGLFVDPAGEAPLTEAYAAFLGGSVDYAAMVRETKRRILARNLAGELEFLKDLAKAIAERDPMTRDHGADSLRRAILEFAAALPVYRTYVNVEGPDETDLAIIAAAVESVKATREVEDTAAVDFVARMLRLDFPDPETQGAALVFAARFQQTTGPVMAKALEDTVFYRHNRLIALNEVGGEPDRFGAPPSVLHDWMRARLAEQPLGLSGTATHDTKRGEDARARIYAISEMPEAWRDAVSGWHEMLAACRAEVDAVIAPEPEFEWLFYQALAGAWPAELASGDAEGIAGLRERMDAYMLKVVREAKVRTSWTAPNDDYESAVSGFVRGALGNAAFLDDFRGRCEPIFRAGAVVSLAQLAIKLAAPGIPDIYRGTEFWDLSLVDPDNRTPVDFGQREAALATIDSAAPAALIADWRSGRVKMRLMRDGLALRRQHPELFAEGDYVPLETSGTAAAHVVAFGRSFGDQYVVAVATRLPLGLLSGSEGLRVPPERWGGTAVVLPAKASGLALRDVVTGRQFGPQPRLAVAEVLGELPVALLHAGAPAR